MREAFSGRERAGFTAAIVAGLAMMVYGSGRLNSGDGRADLHSASSSLPPFKSECIVNLAEFHDVYSWKDIHQLGVEQQLTDPDVSVEELIEFNGLPPDYDPSKVDFADVCVGDGRKYGYVGFYGDVPDSIPHISTVKVTPVSANAQIEPTPFTETTPLPTLTPRPTDISVQPSELTVTENPSEEVLSCQVDSSYQLTKELDIEISDTNIYSAYVCSDTLIEGGYHVTNSHCVATVSGDRNAQYSLIDEVTHRSSATTRLHHESGQTLRVVGANFSHADDVAILYTVPEIVYPLMPEPPKTPCLELGDLGELEKLAPLQLVNYGDSAEDPKQIAVRYLGEDPENELYSLFIDGVDSQAVYDGSTYDGTFWHGGSGGSVVDMKSGFFVGTTSGIHYRTNEARYKLIAEYFDIDLNKFVRVGVIRRGERVRSHIVEPWQSGITVDLPQFDVSLDQKR